MIALATACLIAGLSLSFAGGLGPKIGLGSADQFLLYRLLGIARHRALISGGMLAALGAGALFYLRLSQEKIERIRLIAKRIPGEIRERVAFSGKPEISPQNLPNRIQLACAAVMAVGTAGMVGISLLQGFDVTDEGLYLYEMIQRQPAARFFLSPVAGAFGTFFDNNILYWRYIGFGLLQASAIVFALALARLVDRLKMMQVSHAVTVLWVCAAVSGSLAFFAYGPPTFSYRLASSAGILLAYGGVIFAALAANFGATFAWSLVASLAALLMALGRPPALPAYIISLLLLGGLLLPACGWRKLAQIGLLHATLTAVMIVLLLVPPSFRTEFAAVAERLRIAGQSGYQPSVILMRHLDDVLSLPHDALLLTEQALLIGALAATLSYGIRALKHGEKSQYYIGDIVNWAYAVLPYFLIARYIHDFPTFPTAARQCHELDVIACQGPTPAQTGRDFIEIVAAQLLLLIAVVAMDSFVLWQSRTPPASRSNLRDWGFLILFLASGTLASSFYTDVGWFYHAILSLAPLAMCLCFALMLAPMRRMTTPLWPTLVALLGFQVMIAADIFHNRILFPHRQLGGATAQTRSLSQPAVLRGLRIGPQAYDFIEGVRQKLQQAGFVPGRDLVVAPYNLAGLLVALNAKALGTPWYERLPVDCAFLVADRREIGTLKRVYMISDASPSESLVSCLRQKGLEMAQKRKLGAVAMSPMLSVDIFILPTK